jgi:glutamate/tyrosine decarboxylase-like PLP-dependent enzyme
MSSLLDRTARIASDYLESLTERAVGLPVPVAELRSALGGPLPESGTDPERVVERLASISERGIMASSGPRFFGFVVGGTLPAALAADWLVSTWDQNAGLYILAPAASVVEEVAGQWILDLLGLPPSASFGFVTGCQQANFSALAAARHDVLEKAGWDVEAKGLFGAPEIEVVVGDEAHVTIHTALQMLGLGRDRVRKVAVDEQGRILPDALAKTMKSIAGRPTIVCAQVGNVNSGAIDPVGPIADLCGEYDAWLHIDGAFGLWAGASPKLRPLVAGIERADSWATDAHKWLNVPYDSGIVICAHPSAHRAALSTTAAYLVQTDGAERDPFEWTPEFSRRARGFAVWAALVSLGGAGVAQLIDSGCTRAREFAERMRQHDGVEILNDVVLNQVLVRVAPPEGGDDEAIDTFTRAVITRAQASGELWLAGTTWRGRAAIRFSVSGWSTTEADIDRAVEALLKAAGRSVRSKRGSTAAT